MKNILLFIVCGLIIGCNIFAFRIEKSIDKFDGTTRYYMVNNSYPVTRGNFQFNVQKIIQQNGDTSYYVCIYMVAHDWLFIEEGESLILLVDGTRVGFHGNGSGDHRDVGDRGTVFERAYYNITPKQLKTIANARTVLIKVIGSEYYSEGGFSVQNFANLKKFVEEYVDK
jgi:hypothetical protein